MAGMLSLQMQGEGRVEVYRGRTRLGTVDRLCPHRWGVYDDAGRMALIADDCQDGVAALTAGGLASTALAPSRATR